MRALQLQAFRLLVIILWNLVVAYMCTPNINIFLSFEHSVSKTYRNQSNQENSNMYSQLLLRFLFPWGGVSSSWLLGFWSDLKHPFPYYRVISLKSFHNDYNHKY